MPKGELTVAGDPPGGLDSTQGATARAPRRRSRTPGTASLPSALGRAAALFTPSAALAGKRAAVVVRVPRHHQATDAEQAALGLGGAKVVFRPGIGHLPGVRLAGRVREFPAAVGQQAHRLAGGG